MTTGLMTAHDVQAGDWIAVRAPGQGAPPQRGEVVEVLGEDGHRRYRVRWDDEHESILYPGGGVTVTSLRPGRRES